MFAGKSEGDRVGMPKEQSARIYVLTSLVFIAFLVVTGSRFPFYDAIKWVQANDVYSYLKISSASPGFPTEPIMAHFAQRFIPHYFVGAVAVFLHLPLELVYRIFSISIAIATLFLSARLVLRYAKNMGVGLLVLGVAVLGPYSFRLNILVPGMIADQFYILGLVLCLIGLFERRLWAVFTGIVLSAIGKQMVLLILPGVGLFLFATYKECLGISRAGLLSLSAVGAGFAVYMALIVLSSGFSGQNIVSVQGTLSVFPWLFSDSFSFFRLFDHVLRTSLPGMPFILLIWAGCRAQEKCTLLTLENVAILLIISGPIAYAFFPGPIVQMQNQSRYAAYSAFPMAMLTLNLFPRASCSFKKIDVLLLALIGGAYSYHHKYCAFPVSPKVFLLVHLSGLLMFFAWLKLRFPKLAGQYE